MRGGRGGGGSERGGYQTSGHFHHSELSHGKREKAVAMSDAPTRRVCT